MEGRVVGKDGGTGNDEKDKYKRWEVKRKSGAVG